MSTCLKPVGQCAEADEAEPDYKIIPSMVCTSVQIGSLTKSPGYAAVHHSAQRCKPSSWAQAEPLPGRTGDLHIHPELHPGSKQDHVEDSQPPTEFILSFKTESFQDANLDFLQNFLSCFMTTMRDVQGHFHEI